MPLPPAPPVTARLTALFQSPEQPLPPFDQLTGGAVALAGGKIIGAALRWDGGEAVKLESGWRGRGIEAALQALMSPA